MPPNIWQIRMDDALLVLGERSPTLRNRSTIKMLIRERTPTKVLRLNLCIGIQIVALN